MITWEFLVTRSVGVTPALKNILTGLHCSIRGVLRLSKYTGRCGGMRSTYKDQLLQTITVLSAFSPAEVALAGLGEKSYPLLLLIVSYLS